MARTALITGITGQNGSYLAELILAKGYDVHGLIRRSSSFKNWTPRTFTPELARLMVDADISHLDDEMSGRLVRVDSW